MTHLNLGHAGERGRVGQLKLSSKRKDDQDDSAWSCSGESDPESTLPPHPPALLISYPDVVNFDEAWRYVIGPKSETFEHEPPIIWLVVWALMLWWMVE